MKDIALKPVLTNEHAVAAVFVNILVECTPSVVELVGQKVYLDFALLGGRQDDVALAFEEHVRFLLRFAVRLCKLITREFCTEPT